jgi:hypothetical protein
LILFEIYLYILTLGTRNWNFSFFTCNGFRVGCKNIFCAAVVAIGILSRGLACGNGNEKTLVLQWTNKKSKARKNKLIVANQVLLKDNCVSNVIKQKVLRKYLKNAKMC